MSQEVLINVGVVDIRVAVVEDGRLEALTAMRLLGSVGPFTERCRSLVGDIVLGRVVHVVPAIQAAFVDIGHDRAGFLGAREARCLAADSNGEAAIGELVREGEAILVQVIKDPIGEKGARLTASITIPGRLCVLTPMQHDIAVSRRIEDDSERARLAAIGESLSRDAGEELVPGAGYIFRTVTAGASVEEAREDAVRLAKQWRQITLARGRAQAPVTLHRDLDPVERALRDIVKDTTVRVLIDDARAADAARAYCRCSMPLVEDRIELFEGPGGLFDIYELESEIEGLTHPHVHLPCGGWITIESTEALTAVDVNSGSFTRSAGLEDTGLTVNMEAARELGRQIRLRGIGGLIVVDFMHTSEQSHKDRVLEVLSETLARDGAPVTIAPMTHCGMVEITRKRVREPLDVLWQEDCPTCAGLGRVPRVDTVAAEILRRVEANARAAPGKAIVVRAAPAVMEWFREQRPLLNAALSRKGIFNVEFEPDTSYARGKFDVGTKP